MFSSLPSDRWWVFQKAISNRTGIFMLIYLLLSKSAPIASLGMPQLTFSEVCLVPCGAMVGFQLVQFVPKVRLHSLALLMAWPGFVHMGWAKPGTPPAPIHKTDSTIPFSRGQE